MYNLCNPAWGQEPLSVCVQEQDMDVYPSILPSLHPEYSYSTKKNSDVSIAAPPNPPDHFCSAQQPQRRSYRQATARRNKFKAPAPARGGRRVNSCYWVIFFSAEPRQSLSVWGTTATAGPSRVRHRSISSFLRTPSERSSGSQQEAAAHARAGHCTATKKKKEKKFFLTSRLIRSWVFKPYIWKRDTAKINICCQQPVREGR